MDDLEDLLGLSSSNDSKGLDNAMKALQAITNRRSQREAKQQQERKKVARAAADLDAALACCDEDEARLAAQQQEMEQMGARVVEELDRGVDSEAGGPEPPTWQRAMRPVQALPALQLQDLPELQAVLQQQRQLLDSSSSNGASVCPQQRAATFAWMLSDDAQLYRCPSDAVARAAFHALCYGCSSLSLAAYSRLLAWCGEPEVVAGSQLLPLSQLHQWAGGASSRSSSSRLAPGTVLADSRPPVSLPWLPSAEELLVVLTALGFHPQQQQQQQQHTGPEPCSQQQGQGGDHQQRQQQQAGVDGSALHAHTNLALLLRLLGRVCRAHAAGRLDASSLCSNQQHYLQLLLSLLALMLDQRVLLACSTALPEAFAALIELPPDAAWDRLVRDTGTGSLLAALSGGLGPSHRSAVQLLAQMPRSSRGTLLRQLGALQLLVKQLKPAAKQQAPLRRGLEPQQLRQSLHAEVQALLGRSDKVRALLNSLSVPPGAGGKLQVWALMTALEAADLLLWVDVSTPGVGIGHELRDWFLDWLSALDRVLDKKLSNHRVRSKVAALENAYRFAEFGCVVAATGGN